MLGARRNLNVVRLGRRRILEVSPSVTLRHALPLVSQISTGTVKRHASFPGGQFPGIRIPGQQPPEKGATLKQYVSEPYFRLLPLVPPELFHKSIDLTELAKQGKLDPTIGRDEGRSLAVGYHLSSMTSMTR